MIYNPSIPIATIYLFSISDKGLEDEVVYNDRGVALGRLGYNHKAIDSYRRALASNPKYAVCWFNLGKALFRVGDLNEALKAFKRSTELNPKNRSAWNNRGVTLRQLNKLEESLDCYNRAIKLRTNYSWAWHNKGYVLELLHVSPLNRYSHCGMNKNLNPTAAAR